MARLSALLLVVAVVTGCSGSRETAAPVESGTESVAFVTEAPKDAVIDAATAALVGSDFTITIANERLGLLQTDYATTAGIETALGDSTTPTPVLRDLYVRLTVNAETRGEERIVQIKGSFQRIGGGSAPDRVIGLFWMERLAENIAASTGAEYSSRVSDEMYARALENAVLPGSGTRSRLGQSARAVGIAAAVLFAATLIAGVFSPSSGAN